MHILVVSEHGGKGSPVGMLARDLVDDLRARGESVDFLHVAASYQPGGMRLSRLINYAQIYALLPWRMLRLRIAAHRQGSSALVVATTNPPLIYWASGFWGWILGVQQVVWFQDANVDFLLRRFSLLRIFGIASLMAHIECKTLGAARCVVTLDAAMRDALRRRVGESARVVISPPWATYIEPAQPLRVAGRYAAVRLLYAGNYGASHDLSPLADLLRRGQSDSRQVHLHFIGMSDASQRLIRQQFAGVRAELKFFPRLADIRQLTSKMVDYDFGVVSLADAYAGISSPSKAYTYLSQGLPILYVGPDGTGAHQLAIDGCGLTLADFGTWLQHGSMPPRLLLLRARVFLNPRAEGLQVFADVLAGR